MSNLDLAKRAVACKHWRWTRGMTAICENGWRVLRGTDTWGWDDHGNWPGGPPYRDLAATLNREILPDLTDPATLGCLLALVRKAVGDDVFTRTIGFGAERQWECCVACDEYGDLLLSCAATEAGSLVAALEAAPC